MKTNARPSLMRINVEIDDELIAEAIRDAGASTTEQAVEPGLKALIQLERQEQIRALPEQRPWKDDLDRLRLDA